MPEEEQERGSRRESSFSDRAFVIGSAVPTVVGVIVEGLIERLLGSSGHLSLLAGAAAALVVLVFLTRRPVRRAVTNLRGVWRLPLEGLLFIAVFTVGVLIAQLLVPLAVEGWQRAVDDPCDERTELRVLTAPETRAILQRLGDEFADAQARQAHCRPVRVSVSAASSLSELESAFQTDWSGIAFRGGAAEAGSTVLGPQPDIWIPTSSATVRYLQDKGVDNLRSKGSIATSPLVMAVSDADFQMMGSPTGQTLAEITSTAREAQRLPIAVPNPETSEVGLLATAELARHGSDATRGQDAPLTPADESLPDGNPVDLLCALRTAQRTTPRVAALVPEHVLYDYDAGRPLGDGCAGQVPTLKLYAVYPRDTDALDYPFVRVSWPGQGGRRRDRLADDFRDWLSAARLRAEALRAPDGTAGPKAGSGRSPLSGRAEFAAQWRAPEGAPSGAALGTALKRFRQTRTAVSVLFAVDVSGSMGEAISTQGSRLDQARALLNTSLKLLGSEESGDFAELFAFPSTGDADAGAEAPAPRPARGDDLRRLTESVNGLVAANGMSSPLYRSVGAAVDRLAGEGAGRVRPAVVVLTDGGDSVLSGPNTPRPARRPQRGFSVAWRDELIAKLRGDADSASPRVVFLTIGAPDWCAGTDATLLRRARPGPRSPVSCFDTTRAVSAGERERLLTQIIGELRRG